jgi:hypothetical protein
MSESDDSARREPGTLWRVARAGLLVLAAYAAVGAVAGMVWEAVWTPPGQVIAQHQVFYDSYESLRRVFTGTGWYVVVGAVASALVSLVVCLLTRHRALLTLVAVTVGSALGAFVMLKVGTSLGPPDPAGLAAHTVKRTVVPGDLTVDGTSHLGIKSPYLIWPLASLLVLAAVFITLPAPPFGRDRDDTPSTDPHEAGIPGARHG